MKAGKKNNALEGIKKEQLKRRVFTLDFKAEVVRHKKAENLSWAECGRKFDVLPKLVQQWEKQYEAGKLTVAAGRRAVSPEQAEISRLRAELSRTKMEVSILKKAFDLPIIRRMIGLRSHRTLRKTFCEVRLHSCRAWRLPVVDRLSGAQRDPGGLSRLAGEGAVTARERARYATRQHPGRL